MKNSSVKPAIINSGRIRSFRQRLPFIPVIVDVFYWVILFLSLSITTSSAQSPVDIRNLFTDDAIPVEHADRFGALPIQSHEGRIEPINTFSADILRKLHHSDKIGNLTSDRFLLSLLTMPERWMHVPFIHLKNREISRRYGLPEKQIAYIEIFDENGDYRLARAVKAAFNKSPAERSKIDKDILKLNEQVHIFSQLVSGDMLNLFPTGGEDHKWESDKEMLFRYLDKVRVAIHSGDWTEAGDALESIYDYQSQHTTIAIDNRKLQAELHYNRLNIFNRCKKFYFLLGAHLLMFAVVYLFKKKKTIRTGIRIQVVLIMAAAAAHIYGIALRWYIAGYAPWSNAYETMTYVSLITVAGGLIFARRSTITLALATLFAGVILFVSGLSRLDPQISPLVPVLKSPWLMIHVAVIVAAYGFFGISLLLGVTNITIGTIWRRSRNMQLGSQTALLTTINELSLWAGLALMTAGTLAGAVWANESWGRYWGWDPKETWALITIIAYTVVLHLRQIKSCDRAIVLNIASVLAFATVLMTYFGVNYYLTGMHTYAG
ncbi:MAG: cytochrome c biogenesis protein CcsA [Dysgonamonadaceae bacterium]|jgi:cytochrome c-type biogenesis protein CcsB|nr:cytochrome c biogenesis protein CcsA [Dysgonamonadaceae bacterium]